MNWTWYPVPQQHRGRQISESDLVVVVTPAALTDENLEVGLSAVDSDEVGGDSVRRQIAPPPAQPIDFAPNLRMPTGRSSTALRACGGS